MNGARASIVGALAGLALGGCGEYPLKESQIETSMPERIAPIAIGETDRAEVRRSRRLVVSSIATVGNYEYAFYWYFYLDGSLQLEVKLTGIMSTGAGEPTAHAGAIAPGLVAPVHQHLFCARLDFDVDGPVNEVAAARR